MPNLTIFNIKNYNNQTNSMLHNKNILTTSTTCIQQNNNINIIHHLQPFQPLLSAAITQVLHSSTCYILFKQCKNVFFLP